MTSMRLCGGDITIIPTIRMSIGQISLYGESPVPHDPGTKFHWSVS